MSAMNMTVDTMTASVSGMSPTCTFVLTVATAHLRSQPMPVEPPADLDWNQVFEFATHHGLIPLLCWNLRSQGIRVPDSSTLDAYCRETGVQALRLSAALAPIVTLFSGHQIPVLAFKGPSLACFLYSNETMRSYADIDFLLLPQDVKRASIALQQVGWMATQDIASLHEHSFLQSQCEYGFVRNKILVELQWALAPRFFALDLPLGDMIRRAVTVQVLGAPVKTLATDDLFVVLAVHGAKHLWTRLDWVLDIASLLGKETMDANRVAELAGQYHVERIVAVAALLAAKISGVRIPAPMSALAAKDPQASVIASALFDNAVDGAKSYPPETLAYLKMFASLRERWSDRVRLFTRLFLTPGLSEWQLARLPWGTHWLYRPIRVVRLASRLLRGTW
jgi:hypothetical protein